MRDTLLSWLPSDLRGSRLLDAGCGTGAFAIEAARRGADVTAVDLAPTLVDIAHQRVPRDLGHGSIDFQSGDMLDPSLGSFDYVIAMDSLIHYNGLDCIDALAELCARTGHSVLFTFAPRTPSLAVMHAIGKLFPRSERAPSIQPIANGQIMRRIERDPRLAECSIVRTKRIAGGFYISQAMELRVR
jgi:magnesium-protoporphyrin O-methyltransferase